MLEIDYDLPSIGSGRKSVYFLLGSDKSNKFTYFGNNNSSSSGSSGSNVPLSDELLPSILLPGWDLFMHGMFVGETRKISLPRCLMTPSKTSMGDGIQLSVRLVAIDGQAKCSPPLP